MATFASRARWCALLASLVGVALTGLAVPAHAAEVPAPVVSWPTVTRFNPDRTTYTFTVDDPDASTPGDLRALWGTEELVIPDQGEFTMTFGTEGWNRIEILRCTEAGCLPTGVMSGLLDVRRTLSLTVSPAALGTSTSFPVNVAAMPDGGELEGTWQLTGPGGFSDQGDLPPYLDTFTVDLPADAPDGEYVMTAHAARETLDYGRLEGDSIPQSYTLDSTSPSANVTVPSAVYPVGDGYLDSLPIKILSPEGLGLVDIFIDNAAGETVANIADDGENPNVPVVLGWDGRTNDDVIAPEGRYTARIELTDYAGNKAPAIQREFLLDHARLQTRVFTRTVTAAGSTVGTHVGRCSTLRRPALRGWSGSLGYYSNTRCRAGDAASLVGTVNAVRVPKAFRGRYGTLTVSTYGGASKRRPASIAAFGYLRASDGDVVGVRRLSAPLGSHSGGTVQASGFVVDKATTPSIAWTVATRYGNRYDVKSFTIRLTYTVLA